MIAPSTLGGVTGRTGISPLRYLFPYCSICAFAASALPYSSPVGYGHAREVGMVRRFLVSAGFMVLGRFFMMTRGVLVMLGGFLVMGCCLF